MSIYEDPKHHTCSQCGCRFDMYGNCPWCPSRGNSRETEDYHGPMAQDV